MKDTIKVDRAGILFMRLCFLLNKFFLNFVHISFEYCTCTILAVSYNVIIVIKKKIYLLRQYRRRACDMQEV